MILAAVAGILALPGAAAPSHLDGFVFTFETGDEASPDWCKSPGPCFFDESNQISQFATSTWSGRYLGTFGGEAIYLDGMDYVHPGSNQAYLSFDLLLSNDWGGNGFNASTPDFESLFEVTANGSTILDASFATGPASNYRQSYPGTYPQDSFPAGTGAALYQIYFNVYHFDLTFPIGALGDVHVRFAAEFGPDYDEFPYELYPNIAPRWGLDNVVVSSTPIPEPTTAALLGLGLLALAARRGRA